MGRRGVKERFPCASNFSCDGGVDLRSRADCGIGVVDGNKGPEFVAVPRIAKGQLCSTRTRHPSCTSCDFGRVAYSFVLVEEEEGGGGSAGPAVVGNDIFRCAARGDMGGVVTSLTTFFSNAEGVVEERF